MDLATISESDWVSILRSKDDVYLAQQLRFCKSNGVAFSRAVSLLLHERRVQVPVCRKRVLNEDDDTNVELVDCGGRGQKSRVLKM